MNIIRITKLRNIIFLIVILLFCVTIYIYTPSEINKIPINPKIFQSFDALPDPFDENGVFHSQHASMANKMPDSEGLIDWHDYVMIKRENKRVGPGEQGKGVSIDPSENSKAYALNSQNGFNAYASDKLSLARSVGDIRHSECKNINYLKDLPNVSIIVPFYEEHWTTLLRTVISTLNRAPPELIHEVILVDDGSTHKPFLKEDLANYIKKTFPNDFVKILRNEKREGLIRTRLVGARAATGDVFVFLDSHVEASTNWLPPLLDPIARNYKTVTCPFIDVLDDNTWAFRKQDEGGRGAFAWNFDYKRLPRLKEDAEHPYLPFDSPIMAGGLFAISKKWFWELGGYDEGLYIWGGEQYELSFKIWMCGGNMIDVPCSRIAHAYRTMGFPFPNTMPNTLYNNYKRVAEVWMDDYKEALYNKSPGIRSSNQGDISKQVEFRKNKKCNSFDWFLKNVAFDLLPRYPIKTPKKALFGHLFLADNTDKCLKYKDNKLILDSCSTAQEFSYTFKGEIRTDDQCAEQNYYDTVTKYRCHGYYNNQRWLIKFIDDNIEKGEVKFLSKNNYCLEADPVNGNVFRAKCEIPNRNQVFQFTTNHWIIANEEWKIMKTLPIGEA